ncbi:MAG TPA: ATP-binding protein [Thermoflexales bacterium]|nr:ATP-binding protein [Thermoflexales bacterium]HQX10185.1 ATP-binding protein [Thermoflexales bacterium]HQY23958.1 ATP-binding protein [Thermoflexales bacterium]HQZ52794.1 ATP-binding protein [Thermoflexales bacterium]HRA52917.1 ATP-binding protein [Thermoflexales bacterium]
MNRLWVRLTLAFALMAVLGAGMVAVFANRGLGAQFQRYLGQSRIVEFGLQETLPEYYALHGSWAGLDESLVVARGRGPGFGAGQGRGGGEIIVADAEGRIVSPASRAGAALSAAERDISVPIVVEGRTVGLAAVLMPSTLQFSAAAALFLSEINQVLIQATALAVLAGGLAGLVIARGISRPLGELATAARRVAVGHLSERVKEQGSEEVANVAAAFNEMTVNLQQADAQRRAAETLRRNMVADIAHELRTPLTVIQGNLQAILDGVYPLDLNEIETVHAETAMLSRLVTDLRELSLAEAGQLALNTTTRPLGPLVEGAAQRHAEMAAAKAIALDAEIAEGLPLVPLDPDRTTQVINNLLSNALRYTPSGGRVSVAVTGNPDGVRVTVRDSGPGIAAEDLPRVFDRFWRGEKSRAREKGGSGLGLAIARQWVEAMGGRIGVESRPGEGSAFWFSLPVASDAKG